MAFLRILVGYVAAVLAATAAASAFQTQMVIGRLDAAGAATPLSTRIAMTGTDMVGLAPQFGVVVAIGFLIAFPIAALLKRALRPLAGIAYPLAGAAALAAALVLMPIFLNLDGMTPLAGTRGTLGFALQGLAGALGGLVFAAIAVRR